MNKKMIWITLLVIVIVICSVTTYKVIKKHQDSLMLVSEKYIIEQAKRCYNEKKCVSDTVTLKELYELNYMEKQVNPVSKEYFKEDSFIKKEDNHYSFVIVD